LDTDCVYLGYNDVNDAVGLEAAEASVQQAYNRFQVQFNQTKDVHKNNQIPMGPEIEQTRTQEILSNSTDILLRKEEALKDAKSSRAALVVQLADSNLTGVLRLKQSRLHTSTLL
jgi:hypothetical protein